ncbi:MAG: YbhB/YbcL family Raf kinase inhibitor-like protein [Phycisphaerae bacterium]|nr:YbhB/YbcL family Raf kinase inhibitor-like protein [Phycisphaerae bacterium]
MPVKLESPAFGPGDAIPCRFTADGRNVSPALAWSQVPPTAQELVLIMEDPDAPGREPWVHWVIYKIPPQAVGLPEAVPPGATPPAPAGVFQGCNSWGQLGYGGPAPPRAHGVHHYHFKLFALDIALELFHSLTREQLCQALRGHVIEQGELIGTYCR